MKQIQKKLKSIANSIQALAQRVENIQKQIESEPKPGAKVKRKSVKRSAVKKAARKPSKPAETGTAYALFLKVIGSSKNGISVAGLKAKTGFNDKKIANLAYKAKKQGKIKAADKGVYVKG